MKHINKLILKAFIQTFPKLKYSNEIQISCFYCYFTIFIPKESLLVSVNGTAGENSSMENVVYTNQHKKIGTSCVHRFSPLWVSRLVKEIASHTNDIGKTVRLSLNNRKN